MTEMVEDLRAHAPAAISVGASAGAVEALTSFLAELPRGVPAPILIVVHVPADRPSALPSLFAERCVLPVEEAEDKIVARPGSIYFAPPDYHLLLERDGTIALSQDEPVNFSRPSIDVLFESVAFAFGGHTLGLLLSGASADGAAGLALMRARGGLTWVQTPASALVATMPEAALAKAPHRVLEPRAMGRAVAEWAMR